MKQLEVKIMGQGYLLGCPEGGEERLQQAVQRVDAAMCKIRDAGKIKARDRIAVLAALNIAHELLQCQAKAAPADGETRERVRALLEKVDRALQDVPPDTAQTTPRQG